jgi:hypothetical protein
MLPGTDGLLGAERLTGLTGIAGALWHLPLEQGPGGRRVAAVGEPTTDVHDHVCPPRLVVDGHVAR